MLRVQQHLVSRSEVQVSPGGVVIRLAPVLSLLQQRPHFRSHAPHQVRSSLARPRWVGCSGGVQGAVGVLAAVGVNGRVAGAEERG